MVDMRLRAQLALATVLLATASCSSASTGPSSLEAAGAWGSTTTVEELRIGEEFGADEYMFGRVQSIAVGPDDSIYVSDGQARIVRVYDSDGVFVRNVGRPGEGPGEFAYGAGLAVLADGRLLARDSTRLSIFDSGGEYQWSFPVVPGGRRLLVDGDVNIYAQRFEGDIVLVKYSIEGEELGREAFPPQDLAGDRTFVLGWGEGNIYPFPTETRSAWSPLGYLVTGRNDVYDIELRKPEGTVHLTRDVERSPVGREEQAEWELHRQSLIQRNRAKGGDNVYEPIPDEKPFFREIHVGEDGRIWVFRYVTAEKRHDIEPLPERPERSLLTWREPWTYDVFEPDGTFLGSALVPESFFPHVFRGERIWGVHADIEGVERVLRLRVDPYAISSILSS